MPVSYTHLDVYKRQRRRTGCKPIAIKLLIVQSIDNAVRIEDILAIDTEVVELLQQKNLDMLNLDDLWVNDDRFDTRCV